MRHLLIFTITIAIGGNALSASAAGVTDVPDQTGLYQLAVETSVFLLNDFKLPSDDKVTRIKDSRGTHRVDFFFNGQRMARTEIPSGSTYCALVASAAGDFSETSKRFQIAGIGAPLPAPREGEQGVSISLSSVQSTSIYSISCYQANSAPAPLTVHALREAIRVQADDSMLAFIGPPADGPVMTSPRVEKAEADPVSKSVAELALSVISPKSAQAAPPEGPTVTAKPYVMIEDTHRAYVRALKKQSSNAPSDARDSK